MKNAAGARDVVAAVSAATPDVKNGAFLTTFRRYALEGGRWVVRERVEPGEWGSEQPFPALTKFP